MAGTSVAFPSLVNCFMTCFLTVFIARRLHADGAAWLIGMIVGAAVGMLLCRLNTLSEKERQRWPA
jgi:hypothetical protein